MEEKHTPQGIDLKEYSPDAEDVNQNVNVTVQTFNVHIDFKALLRDLEVSEVFVTEYGYKVWTGSDVKVETKDNPLRKTKAGELTILAENVEDATHAIQRIKEHGAEHEEIEIEMTM